MSITDLYQRIMQRHCLMADHVSRLAELHVEQGHDINALSTMIDSAPIAAEMTSRAHSTLPPQSDTLPCAPPVHLTCAADCVYAAPHEGACADAHGKDFDGVPFAADFAPDAPDSGPVDTCLRSRTCRRGSFHNGPCHPAAPGEALGIVEPASEVRPVTLHPSESPAVESGPVPKSGARKKHEYTAAEWAMSAHFLAHMKNEPYVQWSPEKQNHVRDEFVAKHKDAPPKNRWGKTFNVFVAVNVFAGLPWS